MTTYEVWSTETDRLIGTIELPRPVSEEIGAPVVVKIKGHIESESTGKKYNAVELRVCKMTQNKKTYWALESNLPRLFILKLEGFTPKLERPSLAQMFFLNRHG